MKKAFIMRGKLIVRKKLMLRMKFLTYLIIQSVSLTACSMKQTEEKTIINHKITPIINTEVTVIPVIPKEEITPTTATLPTEIISPTIIPTQEVAIIKMDVIEKLYQTYGEMDEERDVYLIDYSEEDNTIKTQSLEWLTPWSKEDESRIRELLDLNKVPEGIWDYEYYIYTESEDTTTYKLADDVRIILRHSRKDYTEYSKLPKIDEKLLVSIFVKDNLVYLIYEVYTP